LRSRMREMFNLISFPNESPDKRKWTYFYPKLIVLILNFTSTCTKISS
jgi:hypothetical protein